RRVARSQLVPVHYQPVLPLSLRPYVGGGLSNHGLHRGRHRRLVHPARPMRAAWAHHARHGTEPPNLARAPPGRHPRPSPPHQAESGALNGPTPNKYQPPKVAPLEAPWETGTSVPLILFAFPDPKAETNHYEVAIPKLGSLILTHDWNGEVKGLKSFPPEDRANPIIPFFAFRIMVGIGLIMIAVGIVGAILWLRGTLFTSRWVLAPPT